MRTLLLLASVVLTLPAAAEDWLYLTAPGDTLSGIGQTYLRDMRDWPKVQAANGVAIPKHLPVNTRIKIPVELLKVTPAPVKVTAVNGNVRYKTADGPFQKLEAGTQLNGGERVTAGPRSSASYRFADGTVLTQQASSKLGFGRLAAYGKTGMVSTEIELDGGRLEARAGKQLAPAGGFNVRTPVAVAGLRGTEFRLNVAEDGKTLRNEVLEGTVGVAAQGLEVYVDAGRGTLAEAGKPPEAPRRLLLAPEAAGLPARIESLPLTITWKALAGAVAYRAQLARDAAFTDLLLDDVVKEPAITWQDAPPDGRYFLRLRGIDATELEGANRDHPFELDAVPLPPVALAPAAGERKYSREVELSWAASAEAAAYVVQLAPTAEFKEGVIERRPGILTRLSEPLAEGEWHWRLASIDGNGQQRIFGPHRAFRVQLLPNPPQAAAKADAGLAHFTWGAATGAARYGLEIGSTADLAKVTEARETEQTSLAVALPAGRHYWRVRAIEADAQAGAWGSVSPVVVPPDPPADVAVKVEDGGLLVTWKGAATSYEILVSRDETFAKSLMRQEVRQTSAPMPRPDPGEYWLKIRGMDAEGVAGPYSPAVRFNVRPPTPWWMFLPIILAH